MEAKLKSLRVADLRELLQKASVAIPAKANKSDLIAKVLANPAALQAFESQGLSAPAAKPKAPESSQGGQDDDLLAPPEEFDWGSAAAGGGGSPPKSAGTTTATLKPTNAKGAAPAASSQIEKKSTTQQSASTAPNKTLSGSTDAGKVDEELERRKKRAARFGIPLVEAKAKATAPSNGKASSRPTKSQPQTNDDAAKLEARAARFGAPTASAKKSPAVGQKRARSPAPVDKEETERRKKRAERFSTGGETKAQA